MRAAAKKYLKQDHIQITTENYMEVMEVIYDYPDEFAGKTFTLTGFIYKDPQDPAVSSFSVLELSTVSLIQESMVC